MFRRMTMAVAASIVFAGAAFADDGIVGDWKTDSGSTAGISACGGSFCIKMKTGKYVGKSIGKMTPSGGAYSGTITDPASDKTYSGSAKLSGNTLKMSGCVLGGLICKTQNWKRL